MVRSFTLHAQVLVIAFSGSSVAFSSVLIECCGLLLHSFVTLFTDLHYGRDLWFICICSPYTAAFRFLRLDNGFKC